MKSFFPLLLLIIFVIGCKESDSNNDCSNIKAGHTYNGKCYIEYDGDITENGDEYSEPFGSYVQCTYKAQRVYKKDSLIVTVVMPTYEYWDTLSRIDLCNNIFSIEK